MCAVLHAAPGQTPGIGTPGRESSSGPADGRQPTALVGFGVISLKEGCTITSREFHYPHTFRGIVEISISSGAFNKEVTI